MAAALRSRYALGRVLFAANRLREAEEQFSKKREEKVVTGEVLNALAVVVGRQRRHAEALALFDSAMTWSLELSASSQSE
ncbi:hypothetical protein AB0G05_41540 [Nonomuraea wenchangensis]